MALGTIASDARVRVKLECELLDRIAQDTGAALIAANRALPDPGAIRRQLLGRSIRLTQAMAPAATASANAIRDAFGLQAPVEIYQSAGGENAFMHLLREPILLEIQGRMLSLLDDGALRALIGHEFGHFIAHGPDSPHAQVSALASQLALAEGVPPDLALLASTLSMTRELTADRYALLACRDLDALLRLEMVATTGLPAEELGGDTEGYLAQCRELVEGFIAEGGTTQGVTHPEHGVRAWAAWLFSESDLYLELTGCGPGSRSLGEVDALIERVMRRPGLDGSFQYLEPPPAELHELALACAVLIAVADEVLSDDEAEVLEKAFASLVPDWRSLLDPEHAAQRFEELAPVARAWGAGFLRPLFNLLSHVSMADGVADAREIARMLEIGRLLDGEELFKTLLRPLLRRITVEQREEIGAKPLPVHARDAVAALDAYLSAIARRGGTRVTLRRLLRLLGKTARDDVSLGQLAIAIQRSGLLANAETATIDMDDEFALTAAKAIAAEPTQPAPKPDGLRRAIQRLRDELISGDGHSPSIRLRAIRMGRGFDLSDLSRVSVGHAERCLALAQAGTRAVLVHGEQVGQSKEAASLQRQLVELRREHLARREESGARDLHLGTGFVRGVIDGYVVRAPLVLHPLELEPEGSGGMSLVPIRDEVASANQALFRLVHLKAGLPFPDELALRLDGMAGDPATGIPALVEHLRQIGVDVFEIGQDLHALDPLDDDLPNWKGRRLELEACAVVGLFPQSRSELLHDYEHLLSELEQTDADVSSLLGCAAAILPAALCEPMPMAAADETATQSPTLVIGADPSQVEVVRMAANLPAVVVDGPPGTGKSQVIVNLVADALARGERIAVVSEKRAALDVVANRLAGIGFGDFVSVVHDASLDRKELFQKIQVRLDQPQEATEVDAMADVQDAQAPAAKMRKRMQHLRRAQSGEPSLGQIATFAAGIDATVPQHMPTLDHLSAASAMKLAQIAAACRSWMDLLAPDSPWRPTQGKSRESLADSTPVSRVAIAQSLHASVQSAMAVAAVAGKLALDPALADKHVELLLASHKAVKSLAEASALSTALLESATDACGPLQAVRASWMSESAAWQTHPAPVRTPVPPQLQECVEGLLAKASSMLRFVSPAWWQGRGEVTRQLPIFWPDALGRRIDVALLRALHQRIRLARMWTELDGALVTSKMGGLLNGDAVQVSRTLQAVAEIADAVRTLRGARSRLESLGAWLPADTKDWAAALLERFAAAQIWKKHLAASAQAAHMFHHIDARTAASALQILHRRFIEDGGRVAEIDQHLTQAAALDDAGPRAIAGCADAWPSRWSNVVLKSWANDRVKASEALLPVALRSGAVDDEATGQLANILDARARVDQQRVRSLANAAPLLHVAAAEKHARRTPQQAAREKLLHDVSRQRRLPPLRAFVRTHAEQGLFDAIPVWLVSPETLAVLFPRKPVFDVVIFDEASQCTVANGFPALLRARRVVIAGDDKQMPPTSFFKAARNADEPDPDQPHPPADLLDAESLLTLARQRVPSRRLDWHYRCRDEDLIAFSNHAMYGGTLMTAPASINPAVPPALRWIHVPDAHYADGRNETEAERVVDVLHELLNRAQPPTVGVVTFNLSQRLAVLDAIDRRRSADAAFAQVFAAADAAARQDDRPFVKNIENVQGDERDVIVFSLGHAPIERKHKTRGSQPYVPARFGPVGQRGGERRLNVAVSRAREETIVVASFHPDQLSVARAKNEGPRLFKAYLEYVFHMSAGARSLATRTLDLVRSAPGGSPVPTQAPTLPGHVPLAGQLAEALIARGMNAVVHVGASGFKVDVGIEIETNGFSRKIAILCDEGAADDGAYRRTQRASLLRRRGWQVVHVDGLEWMHNRDGVLARIDHLIARAGDTLMHAGDTTRIAERTAGP